MTHTPDPFAAPIEASPAPATAEIRRCAACGAAAMLCATNYEGTTMFGLVPTGPSDMRDFVCQGCGASVTMHPIRWIYLLLALSGAPLVVIGAVMFLSGLLAGQWALAVGLGSVLTLGGLGMVGTFAWPLWLDRRHPRVPGAVLPDLRFFETHPGRRCSCGAVAPCRKVLASRTNGVYTGTEYTYVCACAREFTVESPLATAISLTAGLFLMGILAAISPPSGDSWGELGVYAVLGILGLGTLAMSTSRLWARWKHPVAPRSG